MDYRANPLNSLIFEIPKSLDYGGLSFLVLFCILIGFALNYFGLKSKMNSKIAFRDLEGELA